LENNTITVRLAGPDDLDYVSRDGYVLPEIIQRKINLSEVFLLTVNKVPAGYLRLEYLWSSIPYIALIWIDEDFRGCGYSHNILAYVENHLREQGNDKLYSSSQVDEPEPQAWHRPMGFVECGIINGINENGIGEVFFRKTPGKPQA